MVYSSILFLLYLILFLPQHSLGEPLYDTYCASCHHPKKIGITAPPLLPPFIEKYSDKDLENIIRNGLPSTKMPSFKNLSDEEIKRIVRSLKEKDTRITWGIREIEKSINLEFSEKKHLNIKDFQDLTFVVERGKNKIWIIEDDKVLDTFEFPNVHGGIKYTLDSENFYIPARDGWIGYYKINKKVNSPCEGGFVGKVRACISLRNITLTKDGKFLLVSCLLPQSIKIIDSTTLKPYKEIELEGKISAIYELYKKDVAIFTFRDKPLIGILDTKTFEVKYKNVEEHIEDFFIDPFDKFIIATSRKSLKLLVYDLDNFNVVFEDRMESMPHLFSAAFWYKDGKFYFSTPHIKNPYISVYQMYDWKFVTKIDIDSPGFFVKTHPNTNYLWVDNGSDKLILINKNDFSKRIITPGNGKKFLHTEFNKYGNIAYLSIYDSNGSILFYDTNTLKEIKRLPASYPVGKYNFINKERKFYPSLFGESIFKEKCWGCHHQTQEAFGPSFRKIANQRTESQITAQILDPKNNYKLLGYKRNSMPSFNLNEYEIESIINYIQSYKDK